MIEGKSIHDIHLGFVELLKTRGEQVVQPRGMPMNVIQGYDKTIGLISAGSISKEKDGSFSIFQDMLPHRYTGIKLDDIGLCDELCWYEAWENKKLQANKERAEKQAATLPRVELIHVIEILSGIINVIQQEKESHTQDGWDPWKQDFLEGLKVPVEIKRCWDTTGKRG